MALDMFKRIQHVCPRRCARDEKDMQDNQQMNFFFVQKLYADAEPRLPRVYT